MRRHHNPRYAPESLERKLHPSGMSAVVVPAEIHVPQTQSMDSVISHPVVVYVAQDSNSTVVTTLATSHSSFSSPNRTIVVTADDPGTTPPAPIPPGSPEPTNPQPPSGGTGPAPPDGNGDPPIDMPSTPGGPPVPA